MVNLRNYIIIAIVFMLLTIGQTFAVTAGNKLLKYCILSAIIIAWSFLYFYVNDSWAFVFGISLIVSLIYLITSKPTIKSKADLTKTIVLKHTKGQLEFYNPYSGFLCYGGAGSGKTVSVGKPLLSEFMRLNFSIFGYDAKENDYTKTAFYLKEKLNYPYPIYNIDLVNISNSYRFNPIKPHLLDDESEVEELFTTFYKVLAKKTELNEWDDKAKGVLVAGAYYLYFYHKDLFTIPHVFSLVIQLAPEQLIQLFNENPICRSYAKSLINSQDSKATMSSIMSTLSGVIASFSANKKITYILTGNDFDFYLNDPKNPKAFFITNTFKYRNQISPFVVLMFVMAMKRINFGNKVPMVAFLDEATTFKIEDLQAYPSELREYLLAMVMLTQNPSKIEKMYGKNDRSSLESNLQNHFYGRTKDLVAQKIFTEMFSMNKEKDKSVTTRTGSSNYSTTTRLKDSKKYEPEYFKSLKNGQFVGSATNSNVEEYNVRFMPYDESGTVEEIPFVRKVTDEDIENQYNLVVQDIQNIIQNLTQ